MGDRGTLGKQGVGEPTPLKSAVGIERRVKLIVAFAFLADDKPGLIVADFDNVCFGHVFTHCRQRRHPFEFAISMEMVRPKTSAQQQQGQHMWQTPFIGLREGCRVLAKSFMAVSIGGAHEFVVELSV
jgi:hypothetical protein